MVERCKIRRIDPAPEIERRHENGVGEIDHHDPVLSEAAHLACRKRLSLTARPANDCSQNGHLRCFFRASSMASGSLFASTASLEKNLFEHSGQSNEYLKANMNHPSRIRA